MHLVTMMEGISAGNLTGDTFLDRPNGRLSVAKLVADAIQCCADVESFRAIAREDLNSYMGQATIADLASVQDSGDVCWFEPGRHYTWRGALVRAELNKRFPIVTMAHSVGYANQVLPTVASALMPTIPGDTIIVPSDTCKQAIEMQYSYSHAVAGIQCETSQAPHIVVVPYGLVDTPQADTSRHLSQGIAAPVIVSVGRLEVYDKADYAGLFRVAKRLLENGTKFELVVGGYADGESHTRLERLKAQILGDDPHVTIQPNLTDDARDELLWRSDIVVSLSNTASESFGLSLVEALAAEKPVVATCWDGYRELVRDGVEGFLVPTWWRQSPRSRAADFVACAATGVLSPLVAIDEAVLYERLRQLVDDRSLRLKLGRAGRRRALSTYRAELLVERILTVVRSSISAARTGTRCGVSSRERLAYVDAFEHFASDTRR